MLLAGRAQVHVRVDERRAAACSRRPRPPRRRAARRARRRARRSRRRARARRARASMPSPGSSTRAPRTSTVRAAARRPGPAGPRSRPLTPPPRAPRRPRAGRRARPCAPRGRRAPARRSARPPSRRPRRVISTPRFIGPGCMTTWPGRSARGGDAVAQRVLAQARARRPRRAACARAACAARRRRRRSAMSAMSCETDDARGLDAARDQRRRPDQRDVRAAGQQQRDVRAGDARVQHVADDRDVHALEAAERLAHRVEVEQALRRVLVLAVAGVDDRGAGVAGGQRRRADLRVADDDDVGPVGVERQDRVLERLALVDRRAARP